MTFFAYKRSLLDQLRRARFLGLAMAWLMLCNVVFVSICGAHDVRHAVNPAVENYSAIDHAGIEQAGIEQAKIAQVAIDHESTDPATINQIGPDSDLEHSFGMQDSHCMHSSGVHTPCIASVVSLPIVLIARHVCVVGAFSAPPSRPNDNLLRPPSFN